jgi:hypothetical protein
VSARGDLLRETRAIPALVRAFVRAWRHPDDTWMARDVRLGPQVGFRRLNRIWDGL